MWGRCLLLLLLNNEGESIADQSSEALERIALPHRFLALLSLNGRAGQGSYALGCLSLLGKGDVILTCIPQ